MDNATRQIKERLSLADVIGEYIALKRAGQHFKGLCPFHHEKTPSFVVSPDKGIWHCFGCFPPGQKIKTPFGYHPIETIDKQHYVISNRTEIQKVLATHQRSYQGDLVTIRLRKLNYPVQLTADHMVYVVRGVPSTRQYKVFARRYRKYLSYLTSGNGERYKQKVQKYFPILKVPAANIQRGDLLLYPIDRSVENIPLLNLEDYLDRKSPFGPKPSRIPFKIPISDDALRLFGYYIAEGSNHRAYIRFSLGNHEEDFAQEIVKLIGKIFGLSASIHRRVGNKTGIEVTACHAYLATIFGNLMGKGAANKHIPFIFQRLPVKKQLVLLDAIHKGDGTTFVRSKASQVCKSITSTSQILAEQLTDIILRSEVFPTVSVEKAKIDATGVKHQEAYTIQWSELAESRYNLIYHSQDTQYWLLPILTLEKRQYQGPVYNLTVDKDHSYIATSFAVANCGEGGDLFSFVQKMEGLDFPGTLKLLAERAGVELPAYRPESGPRSNRARLLEILELAARVYHDILLHQKAGQRAKEYLQSRGVTDDTLMQFQVGYAPKSWQTLRAYLNKKGYSDAELFEAGLAAQGQGGKIYDRFRARIMFPVHDTQGRVVAFGGRITPWHATGEEGKYVNSPETSVYEKRHTVYNLHRAKQAIRSSGHAVVVEGYMDTVLLAQHGVENVVASSGTALTGEHIAQLKRFTNELHFAFDGDAAGLKAAMSATAAAQAAGLRVATVLFEKGKDPADVAHEDPATLKNILAQPRSLVSVLLTQLHAADAGASKETLLEEMLPLIKQAANPVYQGEMIQEVATALHVPETLLFQRLQAAPSAVPTAVSDAPPDAAASTITTEHHLVGLLLLDAPVRQLLWPELKPEHFKDTTLRELFEQLQTLASKHQDFWEWTAEKILPELHDQQMSLAEACRLIAEGERATSGVEAAQEGRHLLHLLQRRHVEGALKALQQKLSDAPLDERNDLLQKFKALAEQLAQLST